jgi:hypothetical protein
MSNKERGGGGNPDLHPLTKFEEMDPEELTNSQRFTAYARSMDPKYLPREEPPLDLTDEQRAAAVQVFLDMGFGPPSEEQIQGAMRDYLASKALEDKQR